MNDPLTGKIVGVEYGRYNRGFRSSHHIIFERPDFDRKLVMPILIPEQYPIHNVQAALIGYSFETQHLIGNGNYILHDQKSSHFVLDNLHVTSGPWKGKVFERGTYDLYRGVPEFKETFLPPKPYLNGSLTLK